MNIDKLTRMAATSDDWQMRHISWVSYGRKPESNIARTDICEPGIPKAAFQNEKLRSLGFRSSVVLGDSCKFLPILRRGRLG